MAQTTAEVLLVVFGQTVKQPFYLTGLLYPQTWRVEMRYSDALKQHNTITPQSRPIPGREQDMVMNDAGGYVFETGSWAFLERFLLIGTEGGTYYVNELELTVRNAENVITCLKEDGRRVVERTIEISKSGDAATNNPALFVLALAMTPKYADEETRHAAAYALPAVARTASHLFSFVAEVDNLRGWGKYLRRAVANWYESKEVDRLGYQVMKYKQRQGWSHRDVLRLSHPRGASQEHDALYRYLTHDAHGMTDEQIGVGLPQIVSAANLAQHAETEEEIIKLITSYRLTHEMIPNQWKKSPRVWEALLYDMPAFAMIRNLGVMTARDLLVPNSNATRHVIETLLNPDIIKRARVHPVGVLKALKTYGDGKGFRGKLTWAPVQSIKDALEDAFYLSFDAVEPTGKNIMFGLDVSGSMYYGGMGEIPSMANLLCSEIASAMLMATYRTERHAETIAFSNTPTPFPVSRHDSLEDIMKRTRAMTFGGTDCSAPMIWALRNGINADAFVIYTDGDTWAGAMHPMQALREYRQKTGINAKLVVVNMKSRHHSFADPQDLGTLDVVGFSASFPTFLSKFVAS
jgi:60 kDa SS-A/Ro ribonucleoprotein